MFALELLVMGESIFNANFTKTYTIVKTAYFFLAQKNF